MVTCKKKHNTYNKKRNGQVWSIRVAEATPTMGRMDEGI